MFDQQIDIDGNLHDLAPEHETMHLFDSAPQIRGQIALETDAPTPDPYANLQPYYPPAEWEPIFSPWRHGGWYVSNVRYPSGGVGCVSRQWALDHKWRIVDDPRGGAFPGGPNDHTYRNRTEAARAEYAIAAVQYLQASKG